MGCLLRVNEEHFTSSIIVILFKALTFSFVYSVAYWKLHNSFLKNYYENSNQLSCLGCSGDDYLLPAFRKRENNINNLGLKHKSLEFLISLHQQKAERC